MYNVHVHSLHCMLLVAQYLSMITFVTRIAIAFPKIYPFVSNYTKQNDFSICWHSLYPECQSIRKRNVPVTGTFPNARAGSPNPQKPMS